MSESTASESTSWLQPSWARLGVAALVALLGFLLPQEIPLEWYPLNNPGTDINYLEISCAANVTGEVQIWYDLAQHGHRPIDTIRWPISPTTQTYTYTFPLPDAPIVEMQVRPPVAGGALTIRQMRIINRRGEEVRRFTRDLFRARHEIAAIVPLPDGWKVVSSVDATDPYARIELFSPIIPVGKDHRNLLRCLLSTGYLAMMLWILLLAVLFTFYRPKLDFTPRQQSEPSQEHEPQGDLGRQSRGGRSGWRDLLVHLGFMAGLAIAFAFVGNRGLIKNSVHYARYVAPKIPPGLSLEFDLVCSGPASSQLFWDTGAGFNEAQSLRQTYEPHLGLQILRFPLTAKPIRALRFDPSETEGKLLIRGIRIIDAGQNTRAVLPFDSLQAMREIASLKAGPTELVVETTPGSKDPILQFTPAAVAAVNQAMAKQ